MMLEGADSIHPSIHIRLMFGNGNSDSYRLLLLLKYAGVPSSCDNYEINLFHGRWGRSLRMSGVCAEVTRGYNGWMIGWRSSLLILVRLSDGISVELRGRSHG